MAQNLFADHDCPKVGFTATPLDLSHMYDKLIVAGTKQELRDCGALLRADYFAGPEIDTSKLKEKDYQSNGDFSPSAISRLFSTKAKTVLSAEVIKWYNIVNPLGTPTILFAPGVKESLWFAKQFERAGIRAAHIDGKDLYLDGEEHKTNDDNRREILRAFGDGDISVICNRFVLREGIDVPQMGCVILATPFGSLSSYVQSVGRVLRNHPSLDTVSVLDMGGNWTRFPSPNVDVPWEEYWYKTPAQIRNQRADRLREKKELEPVRCGKCGRIMAPGSRSCLCGFQIEKSTREVLQLDGKVKQIAGDVYKPRVTKLKDNTADLWESMYWRAFKSKNKMTFRQAEGLFFYENFYWPPRDLPKMPKNSELMDMRVCDTDRDYLHEKVEVPVEPPSQPEVVQRELW